MKIEGFRIQGFKSISDLTVSGLSDINLFYGLNDVGKSNIFEALALWHWVVSEKDRSPTPIKMKALKEKFGDLIFKLGGNQSIKLDVSFSLNQKEFSTLNSRLIPDQETLNLLQKSSVHMICSVTLNKLQNDIKYTWNLAKSDKEPIGTMLALAIPGFHIIDASRRFQTEHSKNGKSLSVTHQNIKQALFQAYLSRDLEQRQRLNAIKKILAGPPFNFGDLDVALDPAENKIDIGFIRPEGRLPLENLGSGSQQLLLVLGQIFLNDYPIIALEEPEMNLSPQYQQQLLVALRKLMQDPAVKLNQLFISTHSPYFEFEDNFFDVTFSQEKGTQVAHLPIEKRDQYFPDPQIGPQTGARLNSLNQVELYQGVIDDLNLQRGDLIMFVKNQNNRWEIRPDAEIANELDSLLERRQ